MSKPILSPDATYLEISSPGEFQRFYQGLIDLLKKKLNRINIGGSGLYYCTCGEMHDRCNGNWKPFFAPVVVYRQKTTGFLCGKRFD